MAHPKYKLTYFNLKARAEPIRMIFAVVKVPYEDIRIEREKWPSVDKSSFPWDQVPVLEIDGQVLAQSLAITRYLARKYNLVGESEFEAAKCDEYVDALSDNQDGFRKTFFEPDAAKKEAMKKEFVEGALSKSLAKFEAIANKNTGSDFLVGKKLTWGDIVFANTLEFFEEYLDPKLLDKFPRVKKVKDAVYSVPEIKDWVARRPKTSM